MSGASALLLLPRPLAAAECGAGRRAHNSVDCEQFLKMPWFGSSSSVKYSKKRTYYVAEDGRGRKRASLARQNEAAPPAGILKRSGRTRSFSFPFEDGMVPQEMAAAVPMPSEQKVNAMFAEMVVRALNN